VIVLKRSFTDATFLLFVNAIQNIFVDLFLSWHMYSIMAHIFGVHGLNGA